METLTTSRATLETSNGTEQLARFFPGVERVEVRAILSPGNSKAGTVEESVLVEYANPEHAIFYANLPLEFDDLIQLQLGKGTGRTAAKVIAVQYHQGRKAVAVQFANAQGSWVKRP